MISRCCGKFLEQSHIFCERRLAFGNLWHRWKQENRPFCRGGGVEAAASQDTFAPCRKGVSSYICVRFCGRRAMSSFFSRVRCTCTMQAAVLPPRNGFPAHVFNHVYQALGKREGHLPALHEHCTAYLGLVGRYDVWLPIAVKREIKTLTKSNKKQQKTRLVSFAEPSLDWRNIQAICDASASRLNTKARPIDGIRMKEMLTCNRRKSKVLKTENERSEYKN